MAKRRKKKIPQNVFKKEPPALPIFARHPVPPKSISKHEIIAPSYSSLTKDPVMELQKSIQRRGSELSKSIVAEKPLDHDSLKRIGQQTGESFNSELNKISPKEWPCFACKKGCSYCCYIPVAVQVPELISLHGRLQQLPAAEYEQVRERVRVAEERIRDMTPTVRFGTNVACPLLVDNACSIYHDRPLACRAANSLQVEPCRAAYENPMDPGDDKQQWVPPLWARESLQQGVEDGLAQLGLSNYSVDLIQGLHLVMEEPDSIDKWLCGEDQFIGVRAIESSQDERYKIS